MHEIELRFHLLPEHRERLQRLLAGVRRQSLAAIYFDTAERQLAQAGMGLRLRREGRRWVQTVKGPAEDGMTRLEHNAALPAGAALQPDLSRHAEHPLGERLSALAPQLGALQPTFRTEIRRTQRAQRIRGGEIELALDEGRLLAGDGATAAQLAVLELELELQRGPPGALLRHAHALVARLPLSLDLRSKAERGERLAQGQRVAPARKARPLQLQPRMQPGEALRALLLNTFEQVGANASQIGSGDSRPEHVHQLRVGLRRLRSGLRLFRGLWPQLAHPALPAFEQQAAALFRSLGAVRDADVLHLGLTPQLRAALQAALPDHPLPPAPAGVGGGAAAAAACVRQPAAQQFLIEWLGWIDVLGAHPALVAVTAPPAGAEPLGLRRGLKRRLRRWHRQVQQAAAQFEQLDTEARHELRKRLKRLRYGAEFAAGLFKPERLADSMRPVLKAQELLGELNDLELALVAARARAAHEPSALFELGWLVSRRDGLLARTAALMAQLARAPAWLKSR